MEYMAAQADAHMSAGQSLYERMEAELIELRATKVVLLAALVEVADPCCIRTGDGFRMIAKQAIARATASTTDAGVAG